MSVGEPSTREMQALGALCLAAFCGRFAIVHNAVDELIVHQVSLMAATHLPDWEQSGSRLRLSGRGDPIPEEVVTGVPAELRDSFSRLVDYTVEIGIADIYGAHTDLPRRYLLKAMDLLKAHEVATPGNDWARVQPRPLRDPWGEPVPQEACRPIVERCRALLQGA